MPIAEIKNYYPVVLLFDFDNFFYNSNDDSELDEFDYNLNTVINKSIELFPDTRQFSIRLYGGWKEENQLSKKASRLLQRIENINFFPRTGTDRKLIYGKVEIVTRLLAIPSLEWGYTKKTTRGVHRIRLEPAYIDNCALQGGEGCPAKTISRQTKSKNAVCPIENCELKNRDMFLKVEQKMVDTMLACDLIATSQMPEIHTVCLFSDDMDLLPAVAYSSSLATEKVHMFVKNIRLVEFYKSMLNNPNIREWPC